MINQSVNGDMLREGGWEGASTNLPHDDDDDNDDDREWPVSLPSIILTGAAGQMHPPPEDRREHGLQGSLRRAGGKVPRLLRAGGRHGAARDLRHPLGPPAAGHPLLQAGTDREWPLYSDFFSPLHPSW